MKYFGTDGIRGIANEKLTGLLAYKLGVALAIFFGAGSKALIGHDNRKSYSMLMCSLVGGLTSGGVDVIDGGLLTTPAVCYLTKEGKFDFGVQITASHNKPEYNGLKIFNSLGEKPCEKTEIEIENLINNFETLRLVDSDKIGDFISDSKLKNKYITFMTSESKCDEFKDKIVVDCSNGASQEIAKNICKKLKINAKFIGVNKNGLKINEHCGVLHLETLQKAVLENEAVCGFAFDGDADRVLLIDELGKVHDGDEILYLLGKKYSKEKSLSNDTIVATHFSNFGLESSLKKYSIKVERCDVGDINVFERLKDKGYILGGERNGHIINLKFLSCSDGIYVMTQILSILKAEKKTMSKLFLNFIKFFQVEVNVEVTEKQKENIFTDLEFEAFLKNCDAMLIKDGRMLIRKSGTENLIRILVESENKVKAVKLAKLIEEKIKSIK